MPEAVPASGRVRNFKVCGHVNMVSPFPVFVCLLLLFFVCFVFLVQTSLALDVAPQFFIFRRTGHISFIEMRTYLSFGLILQDIPNSITLQNTRLLPIPDGLLVLPCTRQCRRYSAYSLPPPPFFFPVPDRGTGEGRYLCPRQACATTACSECARFQGIHLLSTERTIIIQAGHW